MIMINIKLSKREILLIFVLAVSALMYIYLSYFIFPSYTRIEELNTELMMKKKVAGDRDKAQKLMENLDSYLEKSKVKLEAMEKKMPYNVRLPELIVNIDSRIAGLGMDIQSISVGEPDTANKEYDIVPVNVSMVGKYDSIIEFIEYIEDNERKFIIDSFDLAPVKRSEAMPFDIAMRTFVLKDPMKATASEPNDYNFFRHDNGKSYPFLENNKKTNEASNDIIEDIEEMEKKYEELDDIVDKAKEIMPSINGIGDGN